MLRAKEIPFVTILPCGGCRNAVVEPDSRDTEEGLQGQTGFFHTHLHAVHSGLRVVSGGAQRVGCTRSPGDQARTRLEDSLGLGSVCVASAPTLLMWVVLRLHLEKNQSSGKDYVAADGAHGREEGSVVSRGALGRGGTTSSRVSQRRPSVVC